MLENKESNEQQLTEKEKRVKREVVGGVAWTTDVRVRDKHWSRTDTSRGGQLVHESPTRLH